jgi:HNH endonuclease
MATFSSLYQHGESSTVGTVSELIQRAGSATRRGLRQFLQALAVVPIHSFRCQREYMLAVALDGEMSLLPDIPAHRGTLHFFCRDCAAAVRAEYQYRCVSCRELHNLADSRTCANCQALCYPREAKRVADQNMRALEHGAEATLTVPEWLQTLNGWNWACWCCRKPYEAIDHYIPIALGGGTTAENCFPICRRCNSMKGASHPDDLLQPSPDNMPAAPATQRQSPA